MLARAYRAATASEFLSARTAWKGMGRRRFCSLAVRPSHIVLHIIILTTLINTVLCSECKVRKCSDEYSSRIENNLSAAEQCAALRAYKECADRTAHGCRGDLNYHSIVTLTSDLMKDNNCSNVSPPNPHPQQPTRPPVKHVCNSNLNNGRRGSYRHCGLFGDPHLRTFDDKFETCKVAGAWPLIDNTYIAVQVTNVPLVEGSRATATDKITVIFKDFPGCVQQKLYQAQTGNLPAAFVDGTTRTERSLLIKEIVAGEHIEIVAKYISTKIVVRQVGRYLTFAIRMPSDLVNTSKKDGLELCVKGCPTRERIDSMDVIPSPNEIRDNSGGIVMSKQSAIAKCSEANVTAIYFNSCVFDLITTGDVNFTMAARKALMDFKQLLPNASIQPRTTSPVLQKPKNKTVTVVYNTAPPRTTISRTFLVSVVLLVHCSVSLLANWRTHFVALLI